MPAQGKSETCLSYRLWIRRDLDPHNGHSAIPASDRTAKIIESDESLTLSITSPLGTSDEIRTPARMALIPPLENRKLGEKIIKCESDPKRDPANPQNKMLIYLRHIAFARGLDRRRSGPLLKRIVIQKSVA